MGVRNSRGRCRQNSGMGLKNKSMIWKRESQPCDFRGCKAEGAEGGRWSFALRAGLPGPSGGRVFGEVTEWPHHRRPGSWEMARRHSGAAFSPTCVPAGELAWALVMLISCAGLQTGWRGGLGLAEELPGRE